MLAGRRRDGSAPHLVYAGASPVTFSDPTGLCAIADCPPFTGTGNGGLSVLPASSSWSTVKGASAAATWAADAAAELPRTTVAKLTVAVVGVVKTRTLPGLFSSDSNTLPNGTVFCYSGRLDCPDYTGDSCVIASKGGIIWVAGQPPSASIDFTISVCVLACISFGTNSSSGGLFQFNPGRTGLRAVIGASAYVSVGTRPQSNGLNALVCDVVCAGGYKNFGTGYGGHIGVGTPGVFVGLNLEL
jgi:hypothetical protein